MALAALSDRVLAVGAAVRKMEEGYAVVDEAQKTLGCFAFPYEPAHRFLQESSPAPGILMPGCGDLLEVVDVGPDRQILQRVDLAPYFKKWSKLKGRKVSEDVITLNSQHTSHYVIKTEIKEFNPPLSITLEFWDDTDRAANGYRWYDRGARGCITSTFCWHLDDLRFALATRAAPESNAAIKRACDEALAALDVFEIHMQPPAKKPRLE
jgi:hypothetical protein